MHGHGRQLPRGVHFPPACALLGVCGGTSAGPRQAWLNRGEHRRKIRPQGVLSLVAVKGMSAMFCPQCGVPLLDRIQFCRACGAGISDAGSMLSTTESGFLSLASAPARPETRAGGQPSAFGGESALPAPRAARKLAARVNHVVTRLVSAGR